eukprot:6204830-Pleurochrysis_carterae.AAC.2
MHRRNSNRARRQVVTRRTDASPKGQASALAPARQRRARASPGAVQLARVRAVQRGAQLVWTSREVSKREMKWQLPSLHS